MSTDLQPYRNLFAPQRPAAQPSAAPAGGGAWDTGLTSNASPAQTTYRTNDSLSLAAGTSGDPRQAIVAIAQQGVSQDLMGANQVQVLQRNLSSLSTGQVASLQGLLNQATQPVEQIFILKAYAAGEPWQNLVQYASEMRGQPAADIISKSTMRDNQDVVQQWQDACSTTVLETAAGEADPRYAWELNKGNITSIDPYGAASDIAQQQKQWLEQYGGVAVQRGQSGGQGIALNQMLNDMLGPITHASYETTEVSNARPAIDKISQILDTGYDVPLRISWDQPNSGQDSGHFVLAMAERGTPGSRELQIHDPWTGKTAWVNEQAIESNNFGPIFNTYARLSHYYAPTPSA